MKGNKRKNYVVRIIFILLLIVVLRRNKIPPIIAIIEGQSMQPALYDRDIVICNPFSRIERGEVVVIDIEEYNIDPEIKMIVKRIIGMPGESIMVENGDLYINNKMYTEGTMEGVYFNSNDNGYWELKSNEYFVVGDNIHNSYDSRFFGPIENSDIKTIIKYKFSLPSSI